MDIGLILNELLHIFLWDRPQRILVADGDGQSVENNVHEVEGRFVKLHDDSWRQAGQYGCDGYARLQGTEGDHHHEVARQAPKKGKGRKTKIQAAFSNS